MVIIVIIRLRVKRKRLQQQSTSGATQPNLELNNYSTCKEIEPEYNDLKSKLGEEPSCINPIDPIYEDLDDVNGQRNELWGLPPLPPPTFSMPIMATNATFAPFSPPLVPDNCEITDEYVKMASPKANAYITADYENITDAINN